MCVRARGPRRRPTGNCAHARQRIAHPGDHLVIRQPDRTLALLPVWMTEPAAASHQLVSSPRLLVERLADVRALIDALLASSQRESSRREGAGDEERTTQPKGSVRREGRGSTPAARPPGQSVRALLSPLLQALLTEAADIGPQDAATRSGAQEDDDDQDHA